MKQIILILTLLTTSLFAQSSSFFLVGLQGANGNVPSWYAIDLDGSTEYAYINSPSGLDLNGANLVSGDNSTFTSTVGDWVGLDSISGGKGYFSGTVSLALSDLASTFIVGHNYTIQLGALSLASSALKFKVGIDSTSESTTGSEVIYAYTFTYHSGDSIQLIGNGADTYTIDNVDVSEAYDLEIEGWFNSDAQDTELQPFFHLGDFINTRLDLFILNNSNILSPYIGNGTIGWNSAYLSTPVIYEFGVWQNWKITFDRVGLIRIFNQGAQVAVLTPSVSVSTFGRLDYGSVSGSQLQIGYYNSARYFNGSIGKTTITRTNGLGETVGTSIYDWKGTDLATMLQDKGTNGNDLTGANVTTDDQTEWTPSYTEQK